MGSKHSTSRSIHLVSPWWRYALILVIIGGMAILGYISARSYIDAPPIPKAVLGPDGQVVFSGTDIMAGQQVFLRYGLMDNSTIWGHGAYLGPAYSAEYLSEVGRALLSAAVSVIGVNHKPVHGLIFIP